MKRCTAHDWHATPRASTPSIMLPGELVPQKCDTCHTRYPCAGTCDHFDCRIERGESIPEWAGGSAPLVECPTCLSVGRIRDGETDNLRRCLDCGGAGSISESDTPAWLVGMS